MLRLCFKYSKFKLNKSLFYLFIIFLFLNFLFLSFYLFQNESVTTQFLQSNKPKIKKVPYFFKHKKKLLNNILQNLYKPENFLNLVNRLKFPLSSYASIESIYVCNKYLGNPAVTPTKQDTWQMIDDDKLNGTYVYSAYYDARKVPTCVKVVSISNGKVSEGAIKYCYLWYKGSSRPDIVEAVDTIMPETHDKLFVLSEIKIFTKPISNYINPIYNFFEI